MLAKFTNISELLAYLHSPRTGDYEWSDAGETLTALLAARITSNFDGPGIAPAGQFGGMSWSGAFDMAGNAKEWIFNEASQEKRFILGGAWNEPSYMLFDADARSPFERSANFGFRCAQYQLTAKPPKPPTVFRKNLVVLRFRLLFTQLLPPVDIRDADRPGQSSPATR